jgi:hypothetical protein
MHHWHCVFFLFQWVEIELYQFSLFTKLTSHHFSQNSHFTSITHSRPDGIVAAMWYSLEKTWKWIVLQFIELNNVDHSRPLIIVLRKLFSLFGLTVKEHFSCHVPMNTTHWSDFTEARKCSFHETCGNKNTQTRGEEGAYPSNHLNKKVVHCADMNSNVDLVFMHRHAEGWKAHIWLPTGWGMLLVCTIFLLTRVCTCMIPAFY